MKKLAIILSFLMLVPGAAFGLEMMNNDAMDDVTGQAGVSIALDDVQMFMNIDRIAWIDEDGIDAENGFGSATGSAGAVGISNFQLDTLNMNAITNTPSATGTGDAQAYELESLTTGALDLNFDYGNTSVDDFPSLSSTYGDVATQSLGLNNYNMSDGEAGGGPFTPRALTIDATSQLPALTEAKSNLSALAGGDDVNIGGVMIGLPTIEIYIPTMSMTPQFYNVEGVGTANQALANDAASGASYGTIQMDGITFTPLGGWLEIAPH